MIIDNTTGKVFDSSGAELSTTFVGVSLFKNTDQTTSATYQIVTFDGQYVDPLGFWGSGGDVIVPEGYGGKYFISGMIWSFSGAYNGEFRGGIYVNGTQIFTSTFRDEETFMVSVQPFFLRELNDGDTVTLRVSQTTGVTGASSEINYARFQMFRVE